MNAEQLQQLQEAEAKYRGMFENAVEGIYQSTPDGRYVVVNPALARMYGYDRPEELLHAVSDISHQIYVDPAFRERFQDEIARTGLVQGLEYQVHRRDGSIIWISESARAVADEQGQVRFYEGFIENITARKQAEAERARLEKQMLHSQKMDAIGTLAGGMAHDFNNILCAMLGYTELALYDRQIQGLTRENLEAVLKSAERAKDLVKRILTFSRQTDSAPQPVKLGDIIGEAAKLLNAMLPSYIEITVDLRTENDVVLADITEIHQVIMNLGTNAGHAMRPHGGRLKYELETAQLADGVTPLPAGEYVHLLVSDTGHGMTPEVMERIFDPFFTTKAVGRGTGLGLTLVQKIVQRGGGCVTVESTPGQGTTFHLYFPRCAQPPAPPRPEDHQILRGKREKILVVDDEVPLLNMMQQRLRQMGYRVITRADSPDALETFRAEPDHFDLVITDHTMPTLQGAELADKLGEIRPDLPVVLMTGLNLPPSFGGSPYAARRAVVSKPIDFVQLSHRLRELLPATAAPRPAALAAK